MNYLFKNMYKLTIRKVETKSMKEKNYVQVGKDEKGEPKYDYVEQMKEKEVDKIIFEQEFEEDDLEIREVASFLNK